MIKRDFIANRGNLKGFIFVFFFRVSHFFQDHGALGKIVGLPFRVFYKIVFRWILCIDIPDSTKIGEGLMVFHGMGLVVHGNCKIGNNVVIRHNTTIGQKKANGAVPVIGNGVDIGAHSIILGDIEIGDNCVIGAGTFVDKNIPANCLVYGSPFVIKKLSNN